MADQAPLNGGSRVRINSPFTEGVIGNIAEFGNDMATLAELQTRLAVIDLKESAARAAWPVALIAGALLLVLGAVPILLFGLARLLVTYLDWAECWSLLLVAVLTLVVAGLLGLGARVLLKHSFDSLHRSREELTRNLAWIKTVLARSGRPAPSQRRAAAGR